MMAHHENLRVWQKAHELALQIYKATGSFPREETYRLVDQLRRASVAIANNLSEGGARQSRREFAQFVSIARGSASEMCYLLLLSKDLHYLDPQQYAVLQDDYNHVSRMLTKMLHSLRNQCE